MKKLLLACTTLLLALYSAADNDDDGSKHIEPRSYECSFTALPIKVDGLLDDKAWQAAQWSEDFVDIRGYDYRPSPKYHTRTKMLYDDKYLYLVFQIQEPHLWGTITQRDQTMYWDNDIEVFIDPDGDSENYQEYEFNVLGTRWDLLLTKPQSLGGIHINNFDLHGLQTAVQHYGTVNNPSDIDQQWIFEMAMPIQGVLQSSYNKHKPMSEQVWRVNFSRVEWLKFEIIDGQYRKIEGTDGFGHEENWVWSPTGAVDMHRPEKWGYLTFLNPE